MKRRSSPDWWRWAIGRASKRFAANGHLPYWRYRLILGQVPIACVDILPAELGTASVRVGLIKRRDEHGHLRWAMIGGGVHRNETLGEAIDRHVKETLGKDACLELPRDEAYPDAVGQYFPSPRAGYGHDPRKHAIALTYWGTLSGPIAVGGEAEDFKWFDASSVPDQSAFGYGHGITVTRVMAALPHVPLHHEPRL